LALVVELHPFLLLLFVYLCSIFKSEEDYYDNDE